MKFSTEGKKRMQIIKDSLPNDMSVTDMYDADVLEKELHNKEVLLAKKLHNKEVSNICLDWVAGGKMCNICGKKYVKKGFFNKTVMTIVKVRHKRMVGDHNMVAYICKECITNAIINDPAAYDEKIKAYNTVHDPLAYHHGYYESPFYVKCFVAITAALVLAVAGGALFANGTVLGAAMALMVISLIPVSRAICDGRYIYKRNIGE